MIGKEELVPYLLNAMVGLFISLGIFGFLITIVGGAYLRSATVEEIRDSFLWMEGGAFILIGIMLYFAINRKRTD